MAQIYGIIRIGHRLMRKKSMEGLLVSAAHLEDVQQRLREFGYLV